MTKNQTTDKDAILSAIAERMKDVVNASLR